MKKEQFYEQLGDIDEKIIKECEEQKTRRRKPILKYGAIIAACFVAAIGTSVLYHMQNLSGSKDRNVLLAEATYPQEYQGRKVAPTPGMSILPIVEGRKMPERYIYNEHEGNRMVRKGDWKLVSANCREDEWELYNIKEDRTEQNNLIKQYPEKAAELEKAYFEWADRSDVLYFPKFWNTYNKDRVKDFKEYKER